MKKPKMALHSLKIMCEINAYIKRYDIRGGNLSSAASDVLDGAVWNHEIRDLINRKFLTVIRDGPSEKWHEWDNCGGSWTVHLTKRSMKLFWPERITMTDNQSSHLRKLATDILHNGSFALQNAEAGHEKATMKYDNLAQQAYQDFIEYLDSI